MFESLPPLRDVIAQHNLRAEKKLGQNFLLDLNLTDKIARLALTPLLTSPLTKEGGGIENLTVFEIGPGPGGLTRSLLKQPIKKVIAIEYDPRAIEALKDLREASDNRLEIQHADALETDLTALSDGPKAIIANLPYNIATPLLINWLEQIRGQQVFEFMALMFQKEVGERITAKQSTKAYGRLSVMTQWLCDVRKLIDLPPSAFTPAPKIESSVIYFKPKCLMSDAPDFKMMEKVTAQAFNQRRKMLRQSLKSYREQIRKSGIDETLRAENLDIDDFVRLAREV